MGAIRVAAYLVLASALLCMGCATSPEVDSRRQAIAADIEEILSQPHDEAGFGESERCLAENKYRNFRALDDRHILFEGRNDRAWISTLKTRCTDLMYGDALRVKSFSATRICSGDHFVVSNLFDWPWYSRWPWHWGSSWGTGIGCTFGEFQPVTQEQIGEIEAVLRSE